MEKKEFEWKWNYFKFFPPGPHSVWNEISAHIEDISSLQGRDICLVGRYLHCPHSRCVFRQGRDICCVGRFLFQDGGVATVRSRASPQPTWRKVCSRSGKSFGRDTTPKSGPTTRDSPKIPPRINRGLYLNLFRDSSPIFNWEESFGAKWSNSLFTYWESDFHVDF